MKWELPDGWDWVELTSTLDFHKSGAWGDEADETDGTPVIRSTNFSKDFILKLDNIAYRLISKKDLKNKCLKKNDILLEKSGGGPKQPVGRVILFDIEESDRYICGNFIQFLRVNPEIAFAKYLYYWLVHCHKKGITKLMQRKTTGIRNLRLKDYFKIKIPLPPLPIQKKIADILDQAQQLREWRREADKLTDEYLKSVFLDMFGDPVKNEKGWDVKRFDEVTQSRLGKMRDKKQITGSYLKPYLGNSNVKWFNFDLSKLLEMDFTSDEQEKYELKYNDVLICEGGEVGRSAIWRNELTNCFFQKALHRVRGNEKLISQEFLVYLMYFYSKCGGLMDYVSTATISHLTGVKLKKMKIPIPPMSLQNKFANIVEKVERMKPQQSKSKTQIDNLFNSLMQRAFKGELVA